MSQRRVPYCADAQALAEIAIEVCERSITTFRMIIEVLRGRVDTATNMAMEEGRHGYERRQRNRQQASENNQSQQSNGNNRNRRRR